MLEKSMTHSSTATRRRTIPDTYDTYQGYKNTKQQSPPPLRKSHVEDAKTFFTFTVESSRHTNLTLPRNKI